MSKKNMTGAEMVGRMLSAKTPVQEEKVEEKEKKKEISLISYSYLYDKKTERGCIPYRTLVNSLLYMSEALCLDKETVEALKRTDKALEDEYQRNQEHKRRYLERKKEKRFENTLAFVVDFLEKKGTCSMTMLWDSEDFQKLVKGVKDVIRTNGEFIELAKRLEQEENANWRFEYNPCVIYTVDYLRKKYNI